MRCCKLVHYYSNYLFITSIGALERIVTGPEETPPARFVHLLQRSENEGARGGTNTSGALLFASYIYR